MKLREIYNNFQKRKTVISFEVFPPKNEDEHYKNLTNELLILKKFSPSFISLTYGAGGNNNNSLELTKILNKDYNVMPHFTCVCTDRKNAGSHLKEMKEIGIENILALRGDIPPDKSCMKNDFKYANELVEYIKENSDLSIGVAGYPEGHIEAPDIETDITNLKKKTDAGADAIFTQLFFENGKFYDYVEKVRAKDINQPVVAGIMPVISFKQIEKITSLAKITVPKNLAENIEKYKNSPDDIKRLGIDFASAQCRDLIQNCVNGLHFYTLNKSYSTEKILENIL